MLKYEFILQILNNLLLTLLIIGYNEKVLKRGYMYNHLNFKNFFI